MGSQTRQDNCDQSTTANAKSKYKYYRTWQKMHLLTNSQQTRCISSSVKHVFRLTHCNYNKWLHNIPLWTKILMFLKALRFKLKNKSIVCLFWSESVGVVKLDKFSFWLGFHAETRGQITPTRICLEPDKKNFTSSCLYAKVLVRLFSWLQISSNRLLGGGTKQV